MDPAPAGAAAAANRPPQTTADALAGRRNSGFSPGRGLGRVHSHQQDLRADLVIVDDIGLLPVGPDAAEGLYRLVDAARACGVPELGCCR
jgi:hypothetical protein